MLDRYTHRPENLRIKDPKIGALIEDSLAGRYLFDDPSTNLRLIANRSLHPDYAQHPGIACALGLQLLDQETGSGVAVCGYNLIPHDQFDIIMSIDHTPQGNLPGGNGVLGMSRAERCRLMRSNFRTYMVSSLIKLAQALDLPAIRITSAANHPKVQSEQVTFDRGCQIIDNVALACGFNYGEDWNLWKTFD